MPSWEKSSRGMGMAASSIKAQAARSQLVTIPITIRAACAHQPVIRRWFPKALQGNDQCDADSRMQHVEQEVFAIDVIDITLVAVSPARRPRVRDHEPVSAGLKARLAFDDHRPIDDDGVRAPETGPELIVGNARALSTRLSMLHPLLRMLVVYPLLIHFVLIARFLSVALFRLGLIRL